MKPARGDDVVVHCPICGRRSRLNVKVDDDNEFWGKAEFLCEPEDHRVSATYNVRDGMLTVVAFYERAED